MRFIGVLAGVLGSISLCTCGGTPRAPWCAQYSSGMTDCSFYSYEQCTNSLSGVGGVCSPNPNQRR